MEAEAVSKGAEIGWTIYEMLAPILAAALTWVSAKLAGWIRAKTKNELAAGMLVRLQDSVVDAVKAVNQQTVELLGRAKHPHSPGGVKLTKTEANQLKKAAMEHVRAYWGEKGFKELMKVLGLGGVQQLDKVIATKIEAAVNDNKERARAAAADPT